MKRTGRAHGVGFASLGILFIVATALAAEPPKPARAHRVPYQLTDTKHLLVRLKINGKGPFNFIVDTGAPALFVGTEAAKTAGIDPNKRGMTKLDRIEIEGGITMDKVTAVIDDPFQLIGMNRMNAAGVKYHGMLGYNVLARFRIQYDLTDTHLTWTPLDWEPPALFRLGGNGQPAEVAAMSSLANFATAFVGKKPSPVYIERGFLGVTLDAKGDDAVIASILPDSPAQAAGLRVGDQIVKVNEEKIAGVDALFRVAAKIPAGAEVQLTVRRGEKENTVTLTLGKGL
jgi:membrane-associated protease RseP (regulator of RpoE activity)